MRVKCPSCCETYLETTENYNPDVPANGTMFRLLPEYGPQGHNWSCFPPDEWVIGENLECPGCGAPIVELDGRTVILVKEEPKSIVLPLNFDPTDPEMPKEREERPEEGATESQEQETVDPGNDAHVCPECGKPFATSFALIGHMRKHNK